MTLLEPQIASNQIGKNERFWTSRLGKGNTQALSENGAKTPPLTRLPWLTGL